MPLLLVFAIAIATSFLSPSPASACGSHDPCVTVTIPALEGEIPANTPELPLSGPNGLRAEELELSEAGSGSPFAHWHLRDDNGLPRAVVFDQPLRPQTEYRLVVTPSCGGPRQELSVRVGASVPLPTSLGRYELTVVRDRTRFFDSFLCKEREVDAVVGEARIIWSEDAKPWRSLLQWETLVAGERLFSTRNVFAACDGAMSGLEQGQHELSALATLPGTNTSLRTEPVTVTFACNDADSAAAEAEHELLDDAAGSCSVAMRNGHGALWQAALALACVVLRRRRAGS